MIVEVRSYDKKKLSNDSEIKKLMDQAKINEKARILNEKEIKKQTKLSEKEFAKKIKEQKFCFSKFHY